MAAGYDADESLKDSESSSYSTFSTLSGSSGVPSEITIITHSPSPRSPVPPQFHCNGHSSFLRREEPPSFGTQSLLSPERSPLGSSRDARKQQQYSPTSPIDAISSEDKEECILKDEELDGCLPVVCLNQDYPFSTLAAVDVPSRVLKPPLMNDLYQFIVKSGTLSPPCMDSEREGIVSSLSSPNFWLKFWFQRNDNNSSSLSTLLEKIGTSNYTILAIETTKGHVFGAFCSTQWRFQPYWYGTDAFLWRIDQSQHFCDNQVMIYPCTVHGDRIQFCTRTALALGGGNSDKVTSGIALVIDGDLLGGETSACTTFDSPRLCDESHEFEIQRLEAWTLTPGDSIERAV